MYSLKWIFRKEDFDINVVTHVLNIIQSLEPCGVGARSLAECQLPRRHQASYRQLPWPSSALPCEDCRSQASADSWQRTRWLRCRADWPPSTWPSIDGVESTNWLWFSYEVQMAWRTSVTSHDRLLVTWTKYTDNLLRHTFPAGVRKQVVRESGIWRPVRQTSSLWSMNRVCGLYRLEGTLPSHICVSRWPIAPIPRAGKQRLTRAPQGFRIIQLAAHGVVFCLGFFENSFSTPSLRGG